MRNIPDPAAAPYVIISGLFMILVVGSAAAAAVDWLGLGPLRIPKPKPPSLAEKMSAKKNDLLQKILPTKDGDLLHQDAVIGIDLAGGPDMSAVTIASSLPDGTMLVIGSGTTPQWSNKEPGDTDVTAMVIEVLDDLPSVDPVHDMLGRVFIRCHNWLQEEVKAGRLDRGAEVDIEAFRLLDFAVIMTVSHEGKEIHRDREFKEAEKLNTAWTREDPSLDAGFEQAMLAGLYPKSLPRIALPRPMPLVDLSAPDRFCARGPQEMADAGKAQEPEPMSPYLSLTLCPEHLPLELSLRLLTDRARKLTEKDRWNGRSITAWSEGARIFVAVTTRDHEQELEKAQARDGGYTKHLVPHIKATALVPSFELYMLNLEGRIQDTEDCHVTGGARCDDGRAEAVRQWLLEE